MTPTVIGIDYITGCPIIESCFRNQICTNQTEGKCDDKREKGSPLIMRMDGGNRFARIAKINIPLIIVPYAWELKQILCLFPHTIALYILMRHTNWVLAEG